MYYHVDDFRHNFIENLGSLGFTQITAHAHSNYSPGPNNAWFSPGSGDIYFGDGTGTGFNSFAREDKIIYHEYGHAVIYDIQSGISSWNNEEGAISEGTPDYFAGSYTGRSVIGDYAAPSYQRDMSDPEIDSYSEYESIENTQGFVFAHDGGEFFSSILWDIRNNAGISTAQADYLVFEALNGITGSPNFLDFRDAMMTADNAAYSGAHNDLIQNTFASKGVGSYATPPLSPPSITMDVSGFNPKLNWAAVSGVSSYKIYRGTIQGFPNTVNCSLIQDYWYAGATGSTSFTDTAVMIDPTEDILACYYVTSNNASGESSASNKVGTHGMAPLKEIAPGTSEQLPEAFALQQNYPNPFNPSTQIIYALPEASYVSIKVYNIMGQEVATLVNSTINAGFHEVEFDAGNLSSGMYIAKIQAIGTSGEVFTKELKMQLVK